MFKVSKIWWYHPQFPGSVSESLDGRLERMRDSNKYCSVSVLCCYITKRQGPRNAGTPDRYFRCVIVRDDYFVRLFFSTRLGRWVQASSPRPYTTSAAEQWHAFDGAVDV